MRVLFYGPLADAVGARTGADPEDGCTIAELREKLVDAHPNAAAQLLRSRAIVGRDVVGNDYRPSALDVVEFLPPVSGG